MKPFKEKKIVNILKVLGISCLIVFIVSLILMIFYPMFGLGFLTLPVGALCTIISSSISEKDKFTSEFKIYINAKIDLSTNLIQLIKIREEFESIAIKDNTYCLSYPSDIRKIHNKINNQIEILKKFKN